jgi:hypothetical protein
MIVSYNASAEKIYKAKCVLKTTKFSSSTMKNALAYYIIVVVNILKP